jgi:hypothetical protein
MDLEVLPERYAICRFEPDAAQPVWARNPAGAGLLSVTWSDTEMCVVCPDERVPASVAADRGVMAFRIRDNLASTLSGGLAALTAPLSDARVPFLAISTPQTDHLLVSAEDVDRAMAVLEATGHLVTVPPETQGIAEVFGRQALRPNEFAIL